MLKTALKEIQATPDATIMDTVLKRKELQPDAYHDEPYQHPGTGGQSGVGLPSVPEEAPKGNTDRCCMPRANAPPPLLHSHTPRYSPPQFLRSLHGTLALG